MQEIKPCPYCGHKPVILQWPVSNKLYVACINRRCGVKPDTGNVIINILAIETPFGVKRDLISTILSLSYMYERDVKNALYTPLPIPSKEG